MIVIFEKYFDIIPQVELFGNIPKQELRNILDCLKPSVFSYEKGQIVVNAKEKLKGIGIILTGGVKISKQTANGEQTVLKILGSAGIFGEIAALSDFAVAPATVIATNYSEIMFFPPDKITGTCPNLCKGHTQLAQNVIRVISNRALKLNMQINYLIIKSMRSKICTYLYDCYIMAQNNEFTIPFNREGLADYLNVSRPSMSRELGRLRDENIIRYQKNKFTVLDLQSLECNVE